MTTANSASSHDAASSSPSDHVTVTICNERGLHARASAKFVQCADQFDANITVTRDHQSVGGTSIMGLMMLAAGPGSTLVIAATGPDAPGALKALEALVNDGFGEIPDDLTPEEPSSIDQP